MKYGIYSTSKSALANNSHSILWMSPDAQTELHIGNPHLFKEGVLLSKIQNEESVTFGKCIQNLERES